MAAELSGPAEDRAVQALATFSVLIYATFTSDIREEFWAKAELLQMGIDVRIDPCNLCIGGQK